MTDDTSLRRTSKRTRRKLMADTFDTKRGSSPGPWRVVLWLVLTLGCFLAAITLQAVAEPHGVVPVSSADEARPLLPDSPNNPSVQAYNRSILLYRNGEFDEALQEMRAAVRAASFYPPSNGLAFSNLCLMYLTVGKFKNAQAACSKALLVLPDYVPATLNLIRAKKRERPKFAETASN